jgi:hypothetical protein
VLLEVAVLCLFLLSSSVFPPAQEMSEKPRVFTRQIEFDFAGWLLRSLQLKFFENALYAHNYLPAGTRHDLVLQYLKITSSIFTLQNQLNQIYSDPNVADPLAASAEVRQNLKTMNQMRDQLTPLAEGILQDQVNDVAAEMGLTVGGQAIPPVLFRSTPLPMVLIVSPRDAIREDAHINLIPDVPLEQQVALEDHVDKAFNVSSLVEDIGGVGLYPTMVAETNNLNWLAEVISHEWTHNYLTLRPLGMSYMDSPVLRTMNETTASISGKEIGRTVIERYYPELLPPEQPAQPANPQPSPAQPPQPPPFDFNKEMHETRVRVDQLLAEGKVDEAEAYMEARRKIFWENGYTGLRKLNQAYFAFHGAYADQPLGAAGEDPVGAAVRKLRTQSPSLVAFLNKIAWMTSYQDLQQAVGATP